MLVTHTIPSRLYDTKVEENVIANSYALTVNRHHKIHSLIKVDETFTKITELKVL